MSGPRFSGEFERIGRILAPLARGWPGAFDLTDDAAVIARRSGYDLVVTTDTMVAGVHYVGDEPADLVARKLLRVNLSDLAAMGAAPVAYSLSMALPRDVSDDWLEAFAAGLAADQDEFQVAMIGGDSVSTPGPITLTVSAFGEAAEGRVLRRNGARAGDRVWVSGTIGDGAFGLKAVRGELDGTSPAAREFLADRYRLPRPRTGLGLGLLGIATAAMDVSDGLVGDLAHICEVSRVGAELDAPAVPLSPAVSEALEAGCGALEDVLTGGDDYELLFCAPADRDEDIRQAGLRADVPVMPIGRIEASGGVVVTDAQGREIALTRTGFRHA